MADIRVMTFNVRGAPDGDGVNAWENRADLNARVIRRYAPDLIGFQEAQTENLAYYRDQLPDYAYAAGPRANRPGRILFNAISWNTARFELIDSGGFYLSYTPDRWSLAWDSARVRTATWARLHLKGSDLSVLHLNTHLDHLGEKARLEGSRLIARQLTRLRSDGVPVILTGDFNCSPILVSSAGQEMPYSVFQQAGFHDTFEMAYDADGSQPENTFHAFRGAHFKSEVPTSRLRMDWILYLNGDSPLVRTQSCTVIRDADPPVYPSDHYPVLATIMFEARQELPKQADPEPVRLPVAR
jgi:endonuclease/exonuclease/phosphatase family metal-dependent hydrolase